MIDPQKARFPYKLKLFCAHCDEEFGEASTYFHKFA